jgi:MFS family permease
VENGLPAGRRTSQPPSVSTHPAPADARADRGAGAARRLLASLLLTWTGLAMTSVATALLLVDRFGLGVGSGVALAVQVTPNVLLGPLVGDLVSRRSPRALAVGSSLVSGLVVLAYPQATSPAQAQLVSLLAGLAVLPGIPARMALRSAAVTPESQHRFSGQVVAVERVALVLGPLLAGGLVAAAGYEVVFYGETVLAVLAAVLLLRTPEPPAPDREPSRSGRRWLGPYARAGRLFRRRPLLTAYTVTATTYSIGIGVRRLALPALAVLLAGAAGAELGVMTAALAVGGVLGGVALGRVPVARPERWYLALAVAEGVAWSVLARAPAFPATLVVLVVIGLGEGASTALFFSRAQELVPAGEIGRYYSLLSPVTDAAVVGGLLLASLAGGADLARWGPVAIGLLVAVPVVLCPALLRAARAAA